MANDKKSICDKCKRKVNSRLQKSIICEGECKKLWHIECNNIPEQNWSDIIEKNIPWFCIACERKRTQLRKSFNMAAVPITPGISVSSLCSDNANEENNIISLEMIYEELKIINANQEKLTNSVNSLETVLNDYKEIVENLTKENIELRNDNQVLYSKINNIEYHLDSIEQQKLDHNIVINGVPENENENLENIVADIARKLDVSLNTTNHDDILDVNNQNSDDKNVDVDIDTLNSDIKSVNRIKSFNTDSGLPRSIRIVFHNKTKRDLILQSKKKIKLNTEMLQLNTNGSRQVFISEQLTSKKQFLFKAARDLKRDNKVKYAWVKDGEIFIRREENGKMIKIKNIQQLRQL